MCLLWICRNWHAYWLVTYSAPSPSDIICIYIVMSQPQYDDNIPQTIDCIYRTIDIMPFWLRLYWNVKTVFVLYMSILTHILACHVFGAKPLWYPDIMNTVCNPVGTFKMWSSYCFELYHRWYKYYRYMKSYFLPPEVAQHIGVRPGNTYSLWLEQFSQVDPGWSALLTSGARLTKAYDVTIQRYRNSHAKYMTVKRTFCGVWVQNFVWNFKGALWNFTKNFEPIHRQICILWGGKNLTTYDILELWHLKS